uniref:Uncharacterized protein n=1 Tax=Tetranychus urticae TaxID=32264 RepID=T1K442_TETUR
MITIRIINHCLLILFNKIVFYFSDPDNK